MAIDLIMRETTLTEAETADTAALLPMDEENFRAFYDRTSRAVWSYLWRMTSDRQLADDLLQETFYRFYRAGRTHENEVHRRNSLFCIATNVARDSMRRSYRAPTVELPEDISSTDDLGARAEGRTDLARAMTKLKPEQREMLWLAYGHGSSHAEIAEVLGLKTGSVKLLLFRARRKLAEILRGGSKS